MKIPIISVIIPVYNSERYLRDSLNSLLSQTFEDWEAICVNDGSTDSSGLILQEYAAKDKRFIIISEPNSGQSVARNKALELAKGKYIAFLDADDLLKENFLEALYNAAEATNADMAIASIQIEKISKKDGNLKRKYRLQFKEQKVYNSSAELYEALKLPRNCFIGYKLYRRTAYNMHFSPHEYFEDVLFSHQIVAQTHKAVTVKDTCYTYVSNPQSTVNTMTPKKEQDYLKNSTFGLQIAVQNGWNYRRFLRYYVPANEKKFTPLITIKDYGLFKAYYLFNWLLFTKS